MYNPSYLKSGIVLVNKPAGVSSNKVVNMVKYALGAKKCGHLGTLDQEGEGVLPVTVNSATRLFDFYLNKTKTYQTVFVFGLETDTLDLSGKIVKSKECDIDTHMVETAVSEMIGRYNQMPPQYSAKKVNGKTAYKEARKGNVVELKPKEIEIFDFKLLDKIEKNKFMFEITCSSGTYIRCICRDLAYKLDTYGSMQCILRTRCGNFDVKDCITLDDVKNGKIEVISCENLFEFDKIALKKDEALRLLNGVNLKCEMPDGQYKVYDDDCFMGVGNVADKVLTLNLRLM